MSYIEWFDKLSTNFEEVDNQHKKLIALINELHDNIKKGATKLVIDKILNELIRYAIYHFDTEEKIMLMYNDPNYQLHKEEHESFKKKIKEFLERKESQKIIMVDLLYFLKDWLVKHIIVVDKKMSLLVSKEVIN